jgi:hypothetical protein
MLAADEASLRLTQHTKNFQFLVHPGQDSFSKRFGGFSPSLKKKRPFIF